MRTLETLIRLATAHSKLRNGKVVKTDDLNVAVNLIHLSIFGEVMNNEDEEEEEDDKKDLNKAKNQKMEIDQKISKKRVKFGGDQEMEDEEIDSSKPVNKKINNRRLTGPAPVQATSEERPASKKMKIDDAQQVSELFQSSMKVETSPVHISVKKFIFRLISEISNQERSSKVAVDKIWKKYFELSDDMQKNPDTGEVFLNSKDDLRKALDQMEADELTMMNGDDVILTS